MSSVEPARALVAPRPSVPSTIRVKPVKEVLPVSESVAPAPIRRLTFRVPPNTESAMVPWKAPVPPTIVSVESLVVELFATTVADVALRSAVSV